MRPVGSFSENSRACVSDEFAGFELFNKIDFGLAKRREKFRGSSAGTPGNAFG